MRSPYRLSSGSIPLSAALSAWRQERGQRFLRHGLAQQIDALFLACLSSCSANRCSSMISPATGSIVSIVSITARSFPSRRRRNTGNQTVPDRDDRLRIGTDLIHPALDSGVLDGEMSDASTPATRRLRLSVTTWVGTGVTV